MVRYPINPNPVGDTHRDLLALTYLDLAHPYVGIDSIVSKLKGNLETGLIPTDFDQRLAHFGTNRKEAPERTPYWKFFVKAIDDFMLKLLLVCACVDIGFEVGFAHDDKERSTGKFLTLLFWVPSLMHSPLSTQYLS